MLGKTKLRILQIIANSSKHGYALSKDTGISISSIYDHLNELEKLGLIEVKANGRRKSYSLTENGKLFLKVIKTNISDKRDKEMKQKQ